LTVSCNVLVQLRHAIWRRAPIIKCNTVASFNIPGCAIVAAKRNKSWPNINIPWKLDLGSAHVKDASDNRATPLALVCCN